MSHQLKGKNVIVTGGNRGIGQAIAKAFAKKGCNVMISYNSDAKAAEAVVKELQQFGVKAKAIRLNLLKKDDRLRFVKESSEFLGDIDILVNNAGILTLNSFLKLSEDEVKRIFAVNVLGPLFLTQAVGQYMIERQKELAAQNKELKDRCIINITSISSKVVTPGLIPYESTKAALDQLTNSLSMDKDFIDGKIRVNAVRPGLVPTDLNRSLWQNNSSDWQNRVAGIPLGRAGRLEEVAQAVLSIARNSWMTGSAITIDGGRTRNWSGVEMGRTSSPESENFPATGEPLPFIHSRF
jgi:NAD(P)-dependent dehydrogenase (short-subunit alcohol dehydrogenase family)